MYQAKEAAWQNISLGEHTQSHEEPKVALNMNIDIK